MGNKVVQINGNKRALTVDDTEYNLTPGLEMLIVQKHPRAIQYNNDYRTYKNLVVQTKVKSFPNPVGAGRPHSTWKYKHMLRKMIVSGERIVDEEESEDTDHADTVSIGDIGESSTGILPPGLPSPVHNRSSGKAKKEEDREPFYKGYKDEGVVYLPGDINGLTKKLHLLTTEFFAGNTTVRNALVHVLDALLRLKQLTREEYTNITARLAATL